MDSRSKAPARRSSFVSTLPSPYSRPSQFRHAGRSIRFQAPPSNIGDHIAGESSAVNVAVPDQLAPETMPDALASNTPDVANGLSASERILLHKLKKDTKDQSSQISKLTDLLAVAVRENVTLPHCTQWEYVKRRLARIIRSFLLGRNPSTSSIHPGQESIKRAILEDFGVLDDPIVCKQFDQAWGPQSSMEPGLQSRVSRKFRDARGHMTRVMKDELYRLLEIPKPPANETAEVKAVWRNKLALMQEEDKWRYSLDLEDPYGSDAVYGAISKVVIGSKYPKNGEVKLLMNQAAFFVYAMELAMANRNLREGDYREHEAEILKVEEHLQECVPFMKRVKIIDFHLASPVNGSEASSDSLEV